MDHGGEREDCISMHRYGEGRGVREGVGKEGEVRRGGGRKGEEGGKGGEGGRGGKGRREERGGGGRERWEEEAYSSFVMVQLGSLSVASRSNICTPVRASK